MQILWFRTSPVAFGVDLGYQGGRRSAAEGGSPNSER